MLIFSLFKKKFEWIHPTQNRTLGIPPFYSYSGIASSSPSSSVIMNDNFTPAPGEQLLSNYYINSVYIISSKSGKIQNQLHRDISGSRENKPKKSLAILQQ